MVSLQVTLLVTLVGAVWCQVSWPEDDEPTPILDCIASNMQKGTCYEFRSSEFKECLFFPSISTDDPDVVSHLEKNACSSRNTNYKSYFCCPSTNIEDNMIPSGDVCGMSLENNIVGGEFSTEGAWPWLAAIGNYTSEGFQPFCGGTLVTKQHVLTAAHCVTNQNTVVRLGEHNWQIDGDGEIEFDIEDQRAGNHSSITRENDIMLLKLIRPIDEITDIIRPACLPFHLQNENFEGLNLTVVGWGKFDNDFDAISPAPRQANVPVVPVVDCAKRYKKQHPLSRSVIDERHLCAGTVGIDSCNGDSGGPINYLDLSISRFVVVGLVSFGPEFCGHKDVPGVYTRIASYLDWIKESIRQMN